MKKNIGIFLAFSLEQSKSHGISRLLSFILTGLMENNDTHIFIATPEWFQNDIMLFLREDNIDLNRVTVLSTKKNAFLSRIMSFFFQKKPVLPRKKSSTGHLTTIKCHMHNFLTHPLFPENIRKYLSHRGCQFNKIKNTLRKTCSSVSPLQIIRKNRVARAIYIKLRSLELNRLIAMINERPDISVWFVPALFWPEIKSIKAKKIIAVPDVVSVDFPQFFRDAASLHTARRVADSISAGDHFICYSDHVKQKHLVQAFSVHPEKISVIPHAPVDLNNILEHGEINHEKAVNILRNYQKSFLQSNDYLSDYHLDDMRFIFYSSQVRPYKNFFNLIRAYEILLRERFVNVKLVLTGDIKSDPELYQYILDKRLQFDVLSFHNVSPDVLAALNHLAICAVNPTLFEGGFPFTFTESYSVGTPSVMSAIPAVLPDVKDEHLRDCMLFDPYDINDMVNKIEWAIKNRETLLELQKPLYETFRQRDWALVAKEYTQLLTHFSELHYANT